jgi:hypothetical protein
VKSKEIFSGLPAYWLGLALLALAVLAYLFTLISCRPPVEPGDPSRPISITTAHQTPDDGSDEKKNLLERLEFQKKHQQFQASYLDLIQKIGNTDTTKINLRKDRDLFKNYTRARTDFTDTLKKVEDYEKDFRLKCFARMRSLILAVLFYDRKAGTRMTRFAPDELIKIGALQEIPVCPRGGRYSIIYKDGRRLFHCSIHGTLKN